MLPKWHFSRIKNQIKFLDLGIRNKCLLVLLLLQGKYTEVYKNKIVKYFKLLRPQYTSHEKSLSQNSLSVKDALCVGWYC